MKLSVRTCVGMCVFECVLLECCYVSASAPMCLCVYLVQHLQNEAAVLGQPVTLLSSLQPQLVSLALQGRHFLLRGGGGGVRKDQGG